MPHKKTLAHGNRKKTPGRLKTLAYSVVFAAAMPLIASCAPARNTAAPAPVARDAGPKKRCAPKLKDLLGEGEKALKILCRYGREYVMIRDGLIITPRAEERNLEDSLEGGVMFLSVRLDLSWHRKHGIVSWVPSEDSVFILMKNGMLARHLLGSSDDEAPGYQLPFSTKNLKQNSMAYFKKFLFIATPSGELLVASFSNGINARLLQLPKAQMEGGFVLEQDRLFFGKKRIEIKVKKGTVLLPVF